MAYIQRYSFKCVPFCGKFFFLGKKKEKYFVPSILVFAAVVPFYPIIIILCLSLFFECLNIRKISIKEITAAKVYISLTYPSMGLV